MGSGRWTDEDWKSYSSTRVSGKSVGEIYTSKNIPEEFDPKKITVRESRDSEENPQSNAIIISLDVTGSMSRVLHSVAEKLGDLVTNIYEKKPVEDPHIMFMGIGDVRAGDRAPLQVTQFEADIRIAEQLNKIWFEQGGGGNSFESYILSWYFASLYTSIDCFEKRNKKGYLFTIGDEEPTPDVTAEEIERVFGTKPQTKYFSKQQVLDMVSKQYEVFHIIIEEGHNYSPEVPQLWKELLGQKVISLSDHTKLVEAIVSTIQIREGINKQEVLRSWDGDTSVVLSKAISDVVPKTEETGKVVTL